jgi:hypothetical protein
MSNTTKTVDVRAIMNELFSKTDSDAKKLLNNYCKAKYGSSLACWVSQQTDASNPELRRFLVELNKAVESKNWTFFDPDNAQPAEGQAVPVAKFEADKPEVAEPEEDEDEEETADADNTETDESPIPVQDGSAVPANRVAAFLPPDVADEAEEDEPEETVAQATVQPAAPDVTMVADPLAGLVDALVARVVEKIGSSKVDPVEIFRLVDKRIQNGGFPTHRVEEMLNERQVQTIATFLKSQPKEMVRQAIDALNL